MTINFDIGTMFFGIAAMNLVTYAGKYVDALIAAGAF